MSGTSEVGTPDGAPAKTVRMREKLAWTLLGAVLLLVGLEVTLRTAGWLVREDAPADADPAEYTILCEGDSFTYGVAGESFPDQLEQILNERAGRRMFRTINAAVPGANTTVLADAFAEHVERWQPDVVLLTTGENNSWNSIRPRDGSEAGPLALLQWSKVYRLLQVAWVGWSRPDFHHGAPTLREARLAANYFTDFHRPDEEPEERPPVDFTDAQRAKLTAAFELENQLRYDEALVLFQELTVEQPLALDPWLGVSHCLERNERFDDAAAALHRRLYDFPDAPSIQELWFDLGMVLHLGGRHDEAVAAWVDGIRRYPRSHVMFHALANCFYLRGQPVWQALDLTDDIPGIEENLLWRYLSHLSQMTEGYADDDVRALVSESFRADLDVIVQIARSADVPLILSSYPEHAYTEVADVAEAHGLPYIDFRPIFAARFEDRRAYIGPDDFHANGVGNQVMAEAFAEEILRVLDLDLP